MRKLKSVTVLTLTVGVIGNFFITGCGNSVPRGNNETAKKLLKDMIEEKELKLVLKQTVPSVMDTKYSVWENSLREQLEMGRRRGMDVKGWERGDPVYRFYWKQCQNTDNSKMNEQNLEIYTRTETAISSPIQISNIRIEKIDKDARRSINKAEVQFGDTGIKYTARYAVQRNTDGDIYVEIQHLRSKE